jgi:phosphate:Na+ symporter
MTTILTLIKLLGGLAMFLYGMEIMGDGLKQGSGSALKNFLGKLTQNVFLGLLTGTIVTAIIQSSTATIVLTVGLIGAGILNLKQAVSIVLGANIGTCVTALLASIGGTTNAKRVALIHFTNNTIGAVFFTVIVWIFREQAVTILQSVFPGTDPMSLQMRVSTFHVIFNVTTTVILLPFVKQLVGFAETMIRDKKETGPAHVLHFVDDHLLAMPPMAMVQVKKEIDYMLSVAEENTKLSFQAMLQGADKVSNDQIQENEAIIDFTNGALTSFLIKLSSTQLSASDEATIGSYFHVLNDLERIGDHAVNFYEISQEMQRKELAYSDEAMGEVKHMCDTVLSMFSIAKDAFQNLDHSLLPELTNHENKVDGLKKTLTANHYTRLAEGNCSVTHSPYYSSTVMGLERVGDHLVNVGYSILNPTGSQKEHL